MKTREEQLADLGQKLRLIADLGATQEQFNRLLYKGLGRILVQDAVKKLLEENPDLLRDGSV